MALDTATILAQIDDVLARAAQSVRYPTPGRSDAAETASTSENVAAIVATIDRLTPPGDQYRAAAHKLVDQHGITNDYTLAALVGTLRGLRADVEAGYTSSLVELVHAEVFADFLGMASELQRNGFKDAAAVIAGSTLEEHLRKLATKAQLPTTDSKGEPLKASRLNNDLRGSIYNPLQHRAVQAWLDIRNSAAHGKYGEYDHQQVAAMIQGVTEFMTRHPA